MAPWSASISFPQPWRWRRAAVESVAAALGATAPAAATRGAAPRSAPRAAKAAGGRNRRASDQIVKVAARLHDHIKSHPGQGMEQITKALGTTTKNLRLPVRKLLDAKKIKVTGQKRATKYFPT